MSDRTNDEKLKILQERLAQIKEKKATASATKDNIETSPEVTPTEIKVPEKETNPMLLKALKYLTLTFCILLGASYTYNNLDLTNTFTSDEEVEEIKEFVLEYELSFTGEDKEFKNIAITASFENEILAKAMVKDLKVQGYKCDYFFLPNKSNSTKEIYNVFIGPYENMEETNQWTKHLRGGFEIIKL